MNNFPYLVCVWCNESDPKENHFETCDRTFAPKQFKMYGKWIKCTDKLPENDEYVLTYRNCASSIEINWYSTFTKKWMKHNHLSWMDITHWMPLPGVPE